MKEMNKRVRKIVPVIKQQKIDMIVACIGKVSGRKCLDIGSGSGLVSSALRENGGEWISAGSEDDGLDSVRQAVGNSSVYKIDMSLSCFNDESFDTVVIVDFLEHIEGDEKFILEICRVMKDGGQLIINVPHYRPYAVVPALRNMVGLTDKKHGHVRPGYTLNGLKKVLQGKFLVEGHSTYMKPVSEIVEMAMNLAGGGGAGASGADSSSLIYSMLHPVFFAIVRFDFLFFLSAGARLIVRARKVK